MATIISLPKFSYRFFFTAGLLLFLSCNDSRQNSYTQIATELATNNIHTHADQNMFVILVGKSECVHCNIQFASILNDTNITKHFSKENICFVMPFIRDVERKSFEESLSSYLQHKPFPPFIYSQHIYDTLENNLKNAVSGFFIIQPAGTVKLHIGLNAPNIYDSIITNCDRQ